VRDKSLPETKILTTKFTLMALQVLLGSGRVLGFRVVIKSIAIHKSLTTHITFKRSLSCMYIFMLLQEISGIKSFTTNVTFH